MCDFPLCFDSFLLKDSHTLELAESRGLEPLPRINEERFSKPLQYQLCLTLHGWVKDSPQPHIPPLLACFVPTFPRHFSLVDQTSDTHDRFQK